MPQQRADVVAVEQVPRAILVAFCDRQSVSVWVACQDEVGTHFIRGFGRQRQRPLCSQVAPRSDTPPHLVRHSVCLRTLPSSGLGSDTVGKVGSGVTWAATGMGGARLKASNTRWIQG